MAGKRSKLARKKFDPYITPRIKYLINRTKYLEGTPLTETLIGSWPISAKRVLFGWGSVTTRDWPVGEGRDDPLEKEPPGLDEKAKKNRLKYYQRVTTLDEVKRALVGKTYPQTSIYATDDWFEADRGRIPMPGTDSNFVGVHSIPIEGYSDETELLQFTNSWGNAWGDGGHGVLPYEYFNHFAIESWLMASLDQTRPLAMRLKRATPQTIRHVQKPIELMWGDRDVLRSTPLHCREIYNLSTDDKLAWAFAVQRDGFLDIEELFSPPRIPAFGLRWSACQHVIRFGGQSK